MTEFAKRVLFGVIYAIIVLAAVYFHPYGLLAFLVIVYVAGLTELKHLLGGANHKSLYTTATVMGVLALWAHTSFSMDLQNHFLAFYALILSGLFIQYIFSPGSASSSLPVLQTTFSLSYLLIPLALAISIACSKDWSPDSCWPFFSFSGAMIRLPI
jgi:CDP-diglyceride synthetase